MERLELLMAAANLASSARKLGLHVKQQLHGDPPNRKEPPAFPKHINITGVLVYKFNRPHHLMADGLPSKPRKWPK